MTSATDDHERRAHPDDEESPPVARPTRPWAKLVRDDDGAVTEWHSLLGHSLDVAAVFHELITRTLIGQRLARLFGRETLSKSIIDDLTLLTALHDAGKCNAGFQDRWSQSAPPIGHVLELLQFAHLGPSGILTELDLHRVLGHWNDQELAISVFTAAICHHGRIYGQQELDAQGDRIKRGRPWERKQQYEPRASLSSHVHELHCALDWKPSRSTVAKSTGCQGAHLFSGLVTWADWLGSDRRFFPYDNGNLPEDLPALWSECRRKARNALQRVGAVPPGLTALSEFETRFGFSPRSAQEAVDALPTSRGGSLVVLEAATGSGKTEAAFARFQRLRSSEAVEGLYFAVPTRAAAKQLHERLVHYTRRTFGESAPPPVILAVPGYLRVDDGSGTRLPGFETLWPDEVEMRGWAAEHPKRFLTAPIAVGTVDQAIMSQLTMNHAHFRSASMTRSLLVIDEVHASDAYMGSIIEALVHRHLRWGGHAMLLSATLGGEKLARMTTPTRHGPSFDECRQRSYPVLVHRESLDGSLEEIPLTGSTTKSTHLELRATASDPAGLVEVVRRAIDVGASVLVIRNTVKAAQATFDAFAESDLRDNLFRVGGLATLHHSRFAASDRERLDRAIEDVLGKARTSTAQVVIGTQTVEQSLDIDADFLITDLCPADVLLQRMGRLHRHDREDRPAGFEQPRAVVLVDEQDPGHYFAPKQRATAPGWETVYKLPYLQRTLDYLREHSSVAVPSQSRDFVEFATHSESLRQLVDSWPEHGEAALTHLQASDLALGSTARVQLLNYNAQLSELAFPTKEEQAKVSTRLGTPSVSICFEDAPAGPFGGNVTRLNVPAHVIYPRWEREGIPEDEIVVIATTPQETGFAFSIGDRAYTYTNRGLRTDL